MLWGGDKELGGRWLLWLWLAPVWAWAWNQSQQLLAPTSFLALNSNLRWGFFPPVLNGGGKNFILDCNHYSILGTCASIFYKLSICPSLEKPRLFLFFKDVPNTSMDWVCWFTWCAKWLTVSEIRLHHFMQCCLHFVSDTLGCHVYIWHWCWTYPGVFSFWLNYKCNVLFSFKMTWYGLIYCSLLLLLFSTLLD